MSDMQLRQDVLDELEYEPSLNAAHIGVLAEGGVITLTGFVHNYAHKLAAEAAARRVKGVKAIADEIDVRYPSEEKTSDDQIAKRALDILAWDVLVPKSGIQVTVSNGRVTLGGTVDWYYEKKAAEEDVRKLSGVVGVFNKIEIKPPAKAENVKKKIEEALKRHAEVEAEGIRITVRENDNVLIEGKVDNWDERRAVEAAAWSAPGVRVVENQLAIG